jgi:hypothetical protein
LENSEDNMNMGLAENMSKTSQAVSRSPEMCAEFGWSTTPKLAGA